MREREMMYKYTGLNTACKCITSIIIQTANRFKQKFHLDFSSGIFKNHNTPVSLSALLVLFIFISVPLNLSLYVCVCVLCIIIFSICISLFLTLILHPTSYTTSETQNYRTWIVSLCVVWKVFKTDIWFVTRNQIRFSTWEICTV